MHPREWLITIKNKQGGKQKPLQSPVRPSKRAKLLDRRRNTGIRIFDTGYYWNGTAWADLPFLDPRALTPLSTDNASAEPTLALFEQRDDLIFAVDQSEWHNTFRRVDAEYLALAATQCVLTYKGVAYQLQQNPPEFVNGVFRPNGTEAGEGFNVSFPTLSPALANPAYLMPDTDLKVTRERDYGAEAVQFDAVGSFDVFMFPFLVYMLCTAEWVASMGPPLHRFNQRLNGFNFVHPRSVFLDPTHPYHGSFVALTNEDTQVSAADYAPGITESRWFQETFPYRAVEIETLGSLTTTTDIDAADWAVEAEWPDPPGTPTAGVSRWLGVDFLIGNLPAGALVAVIRKAGASYYLWATV